MTSAVNGFSKCGIWPCNNYFPETDYAPSAQTLTLDIPQLSIRPSSSRSDVTQPSHRPSPRLSLQFSLRPDVLQSSSRPDVPQTSSRPDVPEPLPRPDVPQTSSRPDVPQPPPRPDVPQTSSRPDVPQSPASPDIPQPSLRPDFFQTSSRPDVPQSPASPAVLGPYSRSETFFESDDVQCISPQHRTMKETFSVIKTPPDGRCFFRSIVIGMHPKFQTALRDENGGILNALHRISETSKADEMRAACVQQMCESFDSASFDESLVNADMPPHIRYDSMENRIQEMAKSTHMPGELEIIALSKVLRRSIVILKDDFTILTQYGAGDTSQTASPLYVVFTVLGQDVGHYDCVIASFPTDGSYMTASSQSSAPLVANSSSSTHNVSTDSPPAHINSATAAYPATISSDLSSISLQLKKDRFMTRIKKMSKAAILTVSPYKQKLVAAQLKRAKTVKIKSKVATRKIYPETQTQTMKYQT